MQTVTPTYAIFHDEVQRALDHLKDRPELSEIFRKCYPSSLLTTAERLADGTSFVFTGDIPAMWLRDSAAQVRPYIRQVGHDPDIQALVGGLIRRHARYILLDPYANAFNKTANGAGHQTDLTDMSAWVWERKYELDSLCYAVQLIVDYVDATHDLLIFDHDLHQMFRVVVETIRREQRHDTDSSYRFQRHNGVPGDTLGFDGRGTRTNFTGMSWSGFRPSDDACEFGYLIPANMFAVVTLGHLARFAHDQYGDQTLADEAEHLRAEIAFGIQTYGIVDHPKYGPIYAYETDGYGNYALMDDANVPSLLSMPYLGFCAPDDPIYRNTRAFILSPANPYYAEGKFARGIGSPHTPPGRIWPIALVMQGLTSTDPAEKRALLDMLCATTAGTGYMHESFDPDHPAQFSREWFGWANSLFGEFVLRLVAEGL